MKQYYQSAGLIPHIVHCGPSMSLLQSFTAAYAAVAGRLPFTFSGNLVHAPVPGGCRCNTTAGSNDPFHAEFFAYRGGAGNRLFRQQTVKPFQGLILAF